AAVDGIGHNVGEDAQEQPHLIGPEALAGELEDLLRTRTGRTARWRAPASATGRQMAVETPGRQGTEGRLAGPIRRAPGSKPVRTTLLSTIVSRARTARCRTAGPRP